MQHEQTLDRRHFLKMAATVGGTTLALSKMDLLAQAKSVKAQADNLAASPLTTGAAAYDAARTIEAKTFDSLKTIEGLSESQLTQHIGLYQGYVKKVNEIQAQINQSAPDPAAMNISYSPFRELHVEQSFALNGAVLHEYYFENLGGEKTAPSAAFKNLIAKEFGSWEAYLNQLNALGRSARGWVMSAYNLRDHRVHNYLLDSHNQIVPVYVMPILVLDVYEHAYMIDFGTKRPAYLDVFFKNVDWRVVEDRLATMLWHKTQKK